MRHLSPVTLVIAGIIHLLPLSGILGSAQLLSLYGIAFDDPNAIILMRHRAVLFGLVGLFLVYAAFRPAFQPAAFAAGLVSVVSFLGLAGMTGGYNASLSHVIVMDCLALALLILGIAGKAYTHSRSKDSGSRRRAAA